MDNGAGGSLYRRFGGRVLQRRGCSSAADGAAGGADFGASHERACPTDNATTHDCSSAGESDRSSGVDIDISSHHGSGDCHISTGPDGSGRKCCTSECGNFGCVGAGHGHVGGRGARP